MASSGIPVIQVDRPDHELVDQTDEQFEIQIMWQRKDSIQPHLSFLITARVLKKSSFFFWQNDSPAPAAIWILNCCFLSCFWSSHTIGTYFQLVVLSAVNPSPRWLVAREKMAEARKSIGFFRGKFTKHAECELMDCQHQLKEAKQVQWCPDFAYFPIRYIRER